MLDFDTILVVTHVAHSPDKRPSDGPFSAVSEALSRIIPDIEVLQLPLWGFKEKVFWGKWGKAKSFKISDFLGSFGSIKYLIDILLTTFFLFRWRVTNLKKRVVVIGIDPLSTLSLWIFRKMLCYKLVYYCVDFNLKRFEGKLLQNFYEKADELASRFSDQTWVVCQALKDYKKIKYGINSIYIPNSVTFDETIFKDGKKYKKGSRMIWMGTLLTKRQYDILFSVLKQIQEIKPNLELVISPTRDHDRFKRFIEKYGLKKTRITAVNGRAACQKLVAGCDVGIAIYDDQFGSTQFIEPMKIWDFMLGGVPFIISAEPSISDPIKKSRVVYSLDPNNTIPKDSSLRKFLAKKNLSDLQEKCLALAKRYDLGKQIERALKRI